MALRYRGNWTTGQTYENNVTNEDYVTDDTGAAGQGIGTLLYCETNLHVSSGSLADDYAAGSWNLSSGNNAFYNNTAVDGGPRLVEGTLATATETEDKFNAVAGGFDKVTLANEGSLSATATDFAAGERTITSNLSERANKALIFGAGGALELAVRRGTYRGDWAQPIVYFQDDTVKDAANQFGWGIDSVIVCTTGHTSSAVDTAGGLWDVWVDNSSLNAATASTTASASAASTSETNAGLSETAAGLSEAAALTSETNAELSEWLAEAEKLTADSYATQLEDVFVDVYTSDGDGTFTATPTTDYSSLHWAAKSLLAATVGPTGDAATLDVGTTTTLVSGSLATVANSGTTSAAIFDFGIPAGEQGIQGLPGDDGAVTNITGGDGIAVTGTLAIPIITAEVTVHLEGVTSPYVSQVINYTITNYSSFLTYSVAVTVGSVTITDDVITLTCPATAGNITLTITVDGVDVDYVITVQAAGIDTPTNTTPANGAVDLGEVTELTGSAFSWLGVSDTHASSDWQLATDAGFATIIDSATADVVNLESWTPTGLVISQTYYWRVKYTGATNGSSEWSATTTFTTAASFFNHADIHVAGAQAFGVGNYPDTLPAGFTAMASFDDPAHANYGNYQYSDGSVLVFIPRFYYRMGNASSPNFATYGANAIDVVGADTFANQAAANTGGYALHRAFIDGGQEKHGFFIDKYLCSPDGVTSGKSIVNGVPISLTTTSGYTKSDVMTGCTGILADAVVLSRARGAGFNNASVFMYSAMTLLSLAHAQASSNTTYCGWWDATNNFPKGCNSTLADINDGTLTFTTAGDPDANKPLTGSASQLNKTTHNGQDCGVTDINGAMRQVVLGVTNFGTSATATTAIANGDAYVLKESVALSSLTSGWDGANDAWGNTTALANNYDAVNGLFPWGATTGAVYFGSGANNVFSGDQSGTNWLQTACGIQDTIAGADATGTAQFGNDYCYQYNRQNQYLLCAGYWSDNANAGSFSRDWLYIRSYDYFRNGFRASAYGL